MVKLTAKTRKRQQSLIRYFYQSREPEHGDYASPALQLPKAQNYRIGAASERDFYRITVLIVSQSQRNRLFHFVRPSQAFPRVRAVKYKKLPTKEDAD